MECYNPITIPNPRYSKAVQFRNAMVSRQGDTCLSYFKGIIPEEKLQRNFDKQYYYNSLVYDNESNYIQVPCRKCPACIRVRSAEWSGRLAREINYHLKNGKDVAFVTLTYSPKYIKGARSRFKKDVAEFFDRLRSKFRLNIRHYAISELGEKNERFHIHCLLFGIDAETFGPNNPDTFWRDKKGRLHGSNYMLVERWRYGIVDTTIVKTVGAGVYIAGYLTKNRPQKNGEYYVSPIIASNGIGYVDVTDLEVSNIKRCLSDNILPYYEVGGNKYHYPQSMINKYLTDFDKIKISMLSVGRSVSLGGSYKVGSFRTSNYFEYKERLKSYTSPLLQYKVNLNDWSSGKNLKENFNFPNERSEYATFQGSLDASYPQMVAESIIYKYRNIMSNYTPF